MGVHPTSAHVGVRTGRFPPIWRSCAQCWYWHDWKGDVALLPQPTLSGFLREGTHDCIDECSGPSHIAAFPCGIQHAFGELYVVFYTTLFDATSCMLVGVHDVVPEYLGEKGVEYILPSVVERRDVHTVIDLRVISVRRIIGEEVGQDGHSHAPTFSNAKRADVTV